MCVCQQRSSAVLGLRRHLVASRLCIGLPLVCAVDADPEGRVLLGSCGMYVFRREVLQRMLDTSVFKDIGKDLIPAAVEAGLRVRVCACACACVCVRVRACVFAVLAN